ncbi:hypothetical protein LC162_17240, partial [Escherichia coli]
MKLRFISSALAAALFAATGSLILPSN